MGSQYHSRGQNLPARGPRSHFVRQDAQKRMWRRVSANLGPCEGHTGVVGQNHLQRPVPSQGRKGMQTILRQGDKREHGFDRRMGVDTNFGQDVWKPRCRLLATSTQTPATFEVTRTPDVIAIRPFLQKTIACRPQQKGHRLSQADPLFRFSKNHFRLPTTWARAIPAKI